MTDDEKAQILFQRMLDRMPVWVDSPVGQRVWIDQIGFDTEGHLIAHDHEGNDRLVGHYLLINPIGRNISGGLRY